MSEQYEVTSAQCEQWTKRGAETLETLVLPQSLKKDIKESLETPQYGAYHNEGPTLAAHVGKIIETIHDIDQSRFRFDSLGLPPGQTSAIEDLVTKAIQENKDHMAVYAYLHDLKKPDCMNVEIEHEEDGKKKKRQEIFTIDRYKKEVSDPCAGDSECIQQKFKSMGVTKIGYRLSEALTGGESKEHGETSAQYLQEQAGKDTDVAQFLQDKNLILTGVANHELHFQVFSNAKSAAQYEKSIASRFNENEIGFIYSACLIDIAGSAGKDGTSDFSGFRNMVEARQVYLTIQEFVRQRQEEGKPPLRENELQELKNLQGLDKVTAKIESIKNPPEYLCCQKKLRELKIACKEARLKISESVKMHCPLFLKHYEAKIMQKRLEKQN